MTKYFPLYAFGLLLLAGCGGPEETVPPAAQAEGVPFEGKVDPKIAGTWKSEDGRSTLVLNRDGSSANQNKIPSPGGMKESSSKGEWLAHEDTLLLREQGKDAVRYFVTVVDPKTLELRRVKGSNIVIKYKKA
jgi:hypothetical protein